MNKKYITVKKIGSAICKDKSQRSTLDGLGLKKINQTRILEDTLSVRGMINKVKHLVVIC